jgi:ribosomal-protein-alanine N-acetyltransferase
MIEPRSIIRRMQLTDLPAVRTIEKAAQVVAWSEKAFRDCLAAGYDAWVLEVEGIIVAFALSYTKVGECHILNLAVAPQSQRHGYGAKILAHILEHAKQLNTDMVFLEVRVSNQAAINLYRRFNFNEIGVRKDYYPAPNGSKEDALVLALQLTI